MKNVFLTSFASHGREDYNKAQFRLIESVQEAGFAGSMHMRSYDGTCDSHRSQPILLGEYPFTLDFNGCPPHSVNPYAFKPFIIRECIEAGAQQVIWCDSTILMQRDPKPLLEYAATHGVCAFNNEGFPLQYWISDQAVDMMNLSHLELAAMKQIMACVIVFDFNHPSGRKAFSDWMTWCLMGAFIDGPGSLPGFRAHRHDQSILSVLLYQNGIPLLPYGKLCYTDRLSEFRNEVIFLNQGL